MKHARYEVSSVKEKEAKRDASVRAFILLSYRTVCGQCREREREREEIYYGGRGNNKKKKKKEGEVKNGERFDFRSKLEF